MQLSDLIGELAQPAPARLDAFDVKLPDGVTTVVAVITTVVGRTAVWLGPDDAEMWAKVLTAAATKARRTGDLTIATAMPTGPAMPLPGQAPMPPGMPPPPNGHRP